MAFLPQGQLVVDSLMACPQHLCLRSGAVFEAASCPQHQTWNEDNTYSLHVTALLQKHFVSNSAYFRPPCF
jgi:hypothetical protein